MTCAPDLHRPETQPAPLRARLRRLLHAVLLAAACVFAFGAPAHAQVADEPAAQAPADEAGPAIDVESPASPDSPDGVTPVTPVGPEGGLVQVPGIPDIRFQDEEGAMSQTVQLILLVGLSAIAPSLILLTTTFTRFIVVLSLVKNALALQSVPPSQVLVGLSLFLTAFTMSPVFSTINEVAIQPLANGEISQSVAFEDGFEPLKQFMLAQTRDEDLELFIDLAGQTEMVTSPDEVPALTLIPAFVISELRTAFMIGFMVFLPFLLIDVVVAAVLMSMGMMMVPPVFISLPLKLLLFVLVDGWVLMISSLVQSVNGVGVA